MAATTDKVWAEVVFADPSPLEHPLGSVVGRPAGAPATWTVPRSADPDTSEAFASWRRSFVSTTLLGTRTDVGVLCAWMRRQRAAIDAALGTVRDDEPVPDAPAALVPDFLLGYYDSARFTHLCARADCAAPDHPALRAVVAALLEVAEASRALHAGVRVVSRPTPFPTH